MFLYGSKRRKIAKALMRGSGDEVECWCRECKGQVRQSRRTARRHYKHKGLIRHGTKIFSYLLEPGEVLANSSPEDEERVNEDNETGAFAWSVSRLFGFL